MRIPMTWKTGFQSKGCCSVVFIHFQSCFLVVLLFFKPHLRQFPFVVITHQNAAFRVLGFGAAVYPDTGSSGYVLQNGQEAFELRALRNGNAVDECRYQTISVFKGVADFREVLSADAFAT